jgi:NAD(P)-dependent dehydrogenase (short-subunit alcohol dehydrogenase family)
MSQTKPGRLLDKVALVTGAGSGFGAAMARLFASEGAKVVVADINVEGGERVAQEHDNMRFLKMNVTAEAEWEKALKFVISEFGRIDVLVNNAGTSYKNKVKSSQIQCMMAILTNTNSRL